MGKSNGEEVKLLIVYADGKDCTGLPFSKIKTSIRRRIIVW